MSVAQLRWLAPTVLLALVAGCGWPVATSVPAVTRPVRSASIGPFSQVKSLVFMKGVPAAPLYQAKSIKNATEVLKRLWASSRRYRGTIHASPNIETNAYWGPSVLTVTTNTQTIHIYPTGWITKKGQGWVMHYVPNVLTVKVGTKADYVTNPRLYQWFSGGGWQSQF